MYVSIYNKIDYKVFSLLVRLINARGQSDFQINNIVINNIVLLNVYLKTFQIFSD